MKIHLKIVGLLLFSYSLWSCGSSEEKKQNVENLTPKDAVPGSYGEQINGEGMVSLESMLVTLQQQGEFEGKISGKIKDVCIKKGCWLTMDLPNGESMRVTFKDYGFFVPQNAQEYPVVLEGRVKRVTTEVETLRHYAEDGGASREEIEKITDPKEEYSFVATGVLIQEKR